MSTEITTNDLFPKVPEDLDDVSEILAYCLDSLAFSLKKWARWEWMMHQHPKPDEFKGEGVELFKEVAVTLRSLADIVSDDLPQGNRSPMKGMLRASRATLSSIQGVAAFANELAESIHRNLEHVADGEEFHQELYHDAELLFDIEVVLLRITDYCEQELCVINSPETALA